ncbi:MAG: ABC transporter permease subunit/CPBP intramembrane protease [Planctomycetota bacterium]
MRPEPVLTVYRKELLETLRDRRTLILMLVVPVLIYPLIALLVVQVGAALRSRVEERTLAVGFAAEGSPLATRLEESVAEHRVTFLAVEREEARERVERGELAAALLIPGGARGVLSGEAKAELELLYDSGSVESREAESRLMEVLGELRETLVKERLDRRMLPEALIKPYEIHRENLASPRRRGAFLLGGFLSFLLITMALTSAFYPSIDLSAGERERGTLETLLVAPVGRREIIAGKYLTVLTLTLATAILNIACMAVTFSKLFVGVAARSEIEFTMGMPVLWRMLLTLLPLAALLGAASLGIASFARSYKEGQNYLTPLFLVVMVPAMLPLLPNIEMSPVLAAMPVAGPALLFRELLLEEASPLDLLVVFASTLIYAGLALTWASRLYQREEILFPAGEGSLRFRRPARGGPTPSTNSAVALLLVILAILGYLALSGSSSPPVEQALLLPQLLFLGLPLLLVWWFRNRPRNTFSLALPPLSVWPAVLLLFTGVLPLNRAIAEWQLDHLPGGGEELEALQRLLGEILEGYGPYGSIALVALLPGICEELLCRGYLLSGLLTSQRALFAVPASGFLFGLLHVDPSRLLPTTLLGILLGVLVVRSGSLLPAILFHILNNAAAMIAMPEFQESFPQAEVTRLAPAIDDLAGLPLWLASGITLAGFLVLGFGKGLGGAKRGMAGSDSGHSE